MSKINATRTFSASSPLQKTLTVGLKMVADDTRIPTTLQALTLRGVKDLELTSDGLKADEKLKPDEVLVAPKKTGICGSDVHYLLHGKIGHFIVKKPMILGHESSAIVVRVGSDVKHLKKGDRVALEPGETCKTCEECRRGRYELCPNTIFAATPPFDGTLATFYKLPADLAYKLPEHVSLEDGALIEPLAVAVQSAVRVGQVTGNQNVVIFGCGPVGLLSMATCKAFSARRVIAIDVQQSRLDFAKSYAATDIYLPTKPGKDEDPIDYARRNAEEISKQLGITEGGAEAIDLILDCTGAPPCIQTAICLARQGGTVVQVGMGSENVVLPVTTLLCKELVYKGSFRYGPGVYDLAIDLVSQGKIDLKPLVTHRYKFKDAKKAFDAMIEGKGDDGKPPIKALISGPEDD